MVKRVSTHGQGRAALTEALRNREAFKTSGALRGEKWTRDTVTNWDLGRLTEHPVWSNAFMIDHMAGIDFVVWSYDTPIGWVRKDGKRTVPDVRYSLTTSKHQGIVRVYL
jgi:hypothetical protein